MLWGVSRRYRFDPADGMVINTYVRDTFLPHLRRAPGFVAYYWLDAGDGNGVSLSLFADRAGADASVEMAAEFVRANIATLVGPPEIVEGRIAVHS